MELADGTLFGYDIDLMPDVPHTVVLSACEVGRSSVRWGEEAIGMTRIWLHAGTRCVIAAPVIVADDVACELLGAMHEALAAGEAPAEALAAASARTGIIAPVPVPRRRILRSMYQSARERAPHLRNGSCSPARGIAGYWGRRHIGGVNRVTRSPEP